MIESLKYIYDYIKNTIKSLNCQYKKASRYFFVNINKILIVIFV